MAANARLKYILLLSTSTMMTLLTIVLGALPLRLLRVNYGAVLYWSGCVFVSGALLACNQVLMAAAFATLALLIGIYSEAEKQHSSPFASGAISVLSTSGIIAAGVAIWSEVTKTNLFQLILSAAQTVTARALEVNPQLELKADVLASQAPSFIIVVLILALGAALMWEKRGRRWFGLNESLATPSELLNFEVPAHLVWIAIAAGAAALIQHDIQWLQILGMNVLNVMVAIYFLQGLAVAGHAFKTMKISPFWQTLWFIILFVQLFPLVAFIGFVDFWFEFRKRTKKKSKNKVPGIF